MEVLGPAAKHELIFALESWEKQRVHEESRDRKYSNIPQLAAALTVTATSAAGATVATAITINITNELLAAGACLEAVLNFREADRLAFRGTATWTGKGPENAKASASWMTHSIGIIQR